MRYSLWIIVLIPLLLQNQLNLQAQKTPAEYREMLQGMYKETVPLIYPAQLQDPAAQEYLLLDTRETDEFEVSHIPGALHAGYLSFDKKLVRDLPRDTPIVVYCSVGYRSERIGEKLQKMGFSQVYNLYGGIFSWKNEGHEVVNAQGKPTERVHAYNKDWGQWLMKGEKVY